MDKLFNKYISHFEEAILSFSVILMAIVLIGSVISRTVFNSSWTFAEEVGQTLVIVVTFLGIGYCAKKSKHISMSAIFDLVGAKYKKSFMLIISFFTSLAMFYLTYLSILYTHKVYLLGRVTPALRIPTFLTIAIVPIGFLLGAIEYGRIFIKNLQNKEVFLSSENTLTSEKVGISQPVQDGKEEVF